MTPYPRYGVPDRLEENVNVKVGVTLLVVRDEMIFLLPALTRLLVIHTGAVVYRPISYLMHIKNTKTLMVKK